MNSKEYFNDVADEWDEMREAFFSEAVREKAFSIAGVQKGMLAVDMGAGTGFITEGLIQKGVRVIAVDQSEAMLSEMKKKFTDRGEIDYRIGTADDHHRGSVGKGHSLLGKHILGVLVFYHDEMPALGIGPRRRQSRGLQHVLDILLSDGIGLVFPDTPSFPDYLQEFH